MSLKSFFQKNAFFSGLASDQPRLPEIIVMAFLLGLFCLRIWGFGITHTDDAYWFMRNFEGVDLAGDWARSQGRIWALPIGTLIAHALAWQDTFYGEFLRIGSFILFFFAFHRMVRAYCGYRLALLCATLFMALNILRWDGSILTTYPLLTWVSGVILVAAVLMGREYVRAGKPGMAVGAGVALFLSLFNNEGVTLLFSFLFFLSVLGNAVQLDDASRGLVAQRIPRRSWKLFLILVAASALYLALYVGWRSLHPSTYEGHAIAAFNPTRIAHALFHFSTSGSVLHDFFTPYAVVYVDVSAGVGKESLYRIPHYGRDLLHAPLAVLVGVLLAWLSFRTVADAPVSAPTQPTVVSDKRWPWMAMIAGLSIAILPVLPVTLTERYQDWVMGHGVKAYSHTILANFGWSLFLAGLAFAIFHLLRGQSVMRRVLLAVFALSCGLLGTLTFRANDQIADEMRPEAGRWRVLDSAIAMNQSTFKAPLLWIPRLADGSWFGGVPDPYWSEYTKVRYKLPTRVTAAPPDIKDALAGFVMLDYAFDNGGIDGISLATKFRTSAASVDYVVEKIAIYFKRPNALALKDYFLVYQDHNGKSVRTRFSDLKKASDDGTIRELANAPPDASLIRVVRVGADGKDVEICATKLASDFRVMLGTEQIKGDKHLVRSFVLTEGWHPIEVVAVWSKGPRSKATVASAMLPAGDLRMRFDMSTFNGQGFAPGSQTVTVSVQGQKLAQWTFTKDVALPDTVINIPAALREANGDLALQFDVDAPQVPKKLGLSPDERELGLLLRGVKLETLAAPTAAPVAAPAPAK
jgi:hypothetical protein